MTAAYGACCSPARADEQGPPKQMSTVPKSLLAAPMSSTYAAVAERPPRESASAPSFRRQVARFAAVGVVSTMVHLNLFAALREFQGAQVANVLALVAATTLNTALNRSWTFRIHGREGLARHHFQSLVVFAATWGASGGALALLAAIRPGSSTIFSTVVLGLATGLSTAVRFAAMRVWIFGDRGRTTTGSRHPVALSRPWPHGRPQP